MFPITRGRVFCYFALVTVLAGCNSNPRVTITASYLEKNGDETVEVGSVGTMTADIAGAVVSVGGTAGTGISATIAEITDKEVVLDISHPEHKSQQVRIKVGESKDVFFGDGSRGVRLRFTKAT
jgi:hypothetical protein